MTPDEWTGDSGWTTPEDEAKAGQVQRQSKLQRRSEREEQRLADWRLRQKRLQKNSIARIVPVREIRLDTRSYGPLACDVCNADIEDVVVMSDGTVICPECRTTIPGVSASDAIERSVEREEKNPLPRIVRILSVIDTRDYEEEGDRWVAVPGSGTEHACDRCGRSHEVLATVELEDGTKAVVGTGCAKGESMEIQQQLKAGAAFAKKATALHHQIEAAAPLRELKQKIEDQVDALRFPDVNLITNKFDMWTFVAGDASIPIRHHSQFEPLYDRPELTAYYRNQLVRAWRANRLKELGWHDVVEKLRASEKAAERLKRLTAYDPTKG